MAPAKSRNKDGVVKAITTPLGFYVLALLIVEATLTVVLTLSKLEADKVWLGFQWMIYLFTGVVVVVTALVVFRPRNLLYGKEEYSNDALELLALRDQVEDLVMEKIKPECLKKES